MKKKEFKILLKGLIKSTEKNEVLKNNLQMETQDKIFWKQHYKELHTEVSKLLKLESKEHSIIIEELKKLNENQ